MRRGDTENTMHLDNHSSSEMQKEGTDSCRSASTDGCHQLKEEDQERIQNHHQKVQVANDPGIGNQEQGSIEGSSRSSTINVTSKSQKKNNDYEECNKSMALGEEVECSICLSLLCEPLALPCGHTFCRNCLIRSLDDNRISHSSQPSSQASHKRCPTCRSVCYIQPEDHPECLVLSNLIKRLYPGKYEERLAEIQIEKEVHQRTLPCFFYNMLIFPGHTLRLHLFEARYKLMMQRIVTGSRKFAYVPKFESYDCNAGDIALIAELKDVVFHQDGSADLEAKIISRTIVQESFVEDGTNGLFYVKVKEIKDTNSLISTMNEEGKNHFWNLFIEVREKARQLFCANVCYSSYIIDCYGEIPLRNPELLSLWVTSVLPIPTCFTRIEKQQLLSGTDTLKRLQICHERLSLLGHLIKPKEANDGNEGNGNSSSNNFDLNVTAAPFVPPISISSPSTENQNPNENDNSNTDNNNNESMSPQN